MQDKSFLQAMQDLQDRAANHSQEAIYHMILHRTTATNATLEIPDEKMRSIVTNELLTGQIIALLALMRDLRIIDEKQFEEFTTYLGHALASQQIRVTTGHDLY